MESTPCKFKIRKLESNTYFSKQQTLRLKLNSDEKMFYVKHFVNDNLRNLKASLNLDYNNLFFIKKICSKSCKG